jgi:hypothetical protein
VSLNRYAQRRDQNEPDFIAALLAEGFEVMQLAKPCDLLVWRKHGIAFVLIEVKNGAGRLTEDQVNFFNRTVGLPRVAAWTVDEALAAARKWC